MFDVAVNCVLAQQHLRMQPHSLCHGWEAMLDIVSAFNEFIEPYDMIHCNIPLCSSLPLFTSSMYSLSPYHKGVTVKESKILCWLVSPAQRALKKICTSAQSWLKNRHQAHAQNRRLIFRI